MQILTELLPDEIAGHVSLAMCSVEENYPMDILSKKEKGKWHAFESDKRRQEYLATRGLISEMVLQRGLNVKQFTTNKDPHGKPYGSCDNQEYHMSIAHTDTHVLCAISADLPLGIDLEPCHRTVPERLRKRILHEDENKILEGVSTLRVWTIKEALVKLQGQGMRINLNEWIIETMNNNRFTARFNNDMQAKICSFEYRNNWLALAW